MIFKKKKTRPAEPEEQVDLTYEVALLEAANTLAQTAEIAAGKKDTSVLLQIANGWFQMARELDVGSGPAPTEKQPVGFTVPHEDVTTIPERPDPDVED